jgi:diketogulonate reductase-like aldo/keto reductase
MKLLRLNNDIDMPMYGLGLSHNGGGNFSDAIDFSLQEGVRLFDTAARYGTESVLGDRIQNAVQEGVLSSSSDVFVTTKLWHKDCGDIAGACAASLEKLKVDSIDLYLVHWPGSSSTDSSNIAQQARIDTWREMEKLVENGSCRAIGVSNFLESHLHELEDHWSVCPQVNQFEFNPLQHRKELVELCCDMNIQVEGYCPLGKGSVLQSTDIMSMAEKNNITPAQLCIAWSLQHKVVTIPKSTSREHIISNMQALAIQLDSTDMAILDSLDQNLRCTWDPSNVS